MDRRPSAPFPALADRDGVAAVPDRLRDGVDADRPVVSISDIHGYLDDARRALLTLADHPDYDPVVVADDDGRLHWADESYVLVFNGDLIDRGPDNEAVVRLVARLLAEAPPGRVRVTLGNHEMGVLTPDRFGWRDWYSGRVGDDGRRALCRAIRDGHVVAAYEGHGVTYAHAGHPDPYRAAAANDALAVAAEDIAAAVGTSNDEATQRRVIEEQPLVLGLGGRGGRGEGAGLAWLDFSRLPPDAPSQVVGHTRHDRPTRTGNVVCENVIRRNRRTAGGEAVLVETVDGLAALRRRPDGGVVERAFDHPGGRR